MYPPSRRKGLVAVFGAPVTAAAVAVIAWHSPAAADDNAGLHARPAAIEHLERFISILPVSLDVPRYETELFDCPFTGDDVDATITDGKLRPTWREVNVETGEGAIRVSAVFDLDASGDIHIENPYACFGSLSCELSGVARGIRVAANVGLAPDAEGGLAVVVDGLEVDLTHLDDMEVDVHGCAVGNALEFVFDSFEDWILDRWGGTISDFAEQHLADAFRELPVVIPHKLVFGGFEVTTSISGVQISPEVGVKTVGNVSVRADSAGGPAWSAARAVPPTEEMDSRQPTLGDYVVAATDGLAANALGEAWRAGAFDGLVASALPSFEISDDDIARRLGLPSGTRVGIDIDVRAQPAVEFGRDKPEQMEIGLPDLVVRVEVASPGSAPGSATLEVAGRVKAGFRFSASGGLVVEPRALELDRVNVSAGSLTVSADPARIEQLVSDLLLPALTERLATVPIVPSVQAIPGVYFWMREMNASGGWLRAGFDLFVPDPSDHIPPETSIGNVRLVRPGVVTIPVSGTDIGTPGPLLRYSAALDGSPLEDEPKFTEVIRFVAVGPAHTLEVTAVDLTGNSDPSPATLMLEVDGTPPELQVMSSPASIVYGSSIEAAWTAHDDRPNVSTSWQIIKLDPAGGFGDVVESGEAGRDGRLEVSGLGRRDLYLLRITARDEAGNVTSAEYGFSFDQGGCCSAGVGAGSWCTLALLALLLAGYRARGRWLAAVLTLTAATLGAGSSALAQRMGSHFSGPVDGDGATPFWNPAAMVLSSGGRADAGLSLALIRVSFDAPETDGESTTQAPAPQPFVGAIAPRLGRWRFGISAGVPYATGVKWSREDPEGSVTRFYATDAIIAHAVTTPAFSYEVSPRFSVGGGLNVSYSTMRASFDKDLAPILNGAVAGSSVGPFVTGTEELAAPARFESSGIGVGTIAGFLARPTDRLRIGGAIHSPIWARTRGHVVAEYPAEALDAVHAVAPGAKPPALSGDVDTDLDVPLAVFAAVAFQPARAWELEADYRFHDSSAETEMDIRLSETTSPDIRSTELVRGTRDQHSAGVRARYSAMSDRLAVAARVRVENNTIAESVYTPSNIDFQKLEVGAGASWRATENVSVVTHYSHYFLTSVDVDESLYRPVSVASLDAYNHPVPFGRYSGTADQLCVALATTF